MRNLLYVITAAFLVGQGCGGVDPKTNNGSANNGASNNGASNNGASNNGASNNGASNNGTSNNTTLPMPKFHREVATECDNERPPGDSDLESSGGECTSDAECTDGMNGRCHLAPRSNLTHCSYDACNTDDDCGDRACICGEVGTRGANSCVPGNCKVDADCGAGGYCSPTQGDCGAYDGIVAYYCHTVDDECTTDADCGGTPDTTYCAYDVGIGHWVCSSAQCVG